jgi:prepilin-type N-terminal cleavage/methylation domain-containing protein
MFFNPSTKRQRGFTLTESMVAMAVSGVILAALATFVLYSSKSFAALTNYVDLEQKSQIALDKMSREIRQTLCLTNIGTRSLNGKTVTNTLTFLDSDNSLLTYTYVNDVLLREKNGTSTMLLTNVDYLNFEICQRNNVAGTWSQYVAGDVSTCKLISVSWVCSRSILGTKINTESVQTAKIVIRKQ